MIPARKTNKKINLLARSVALTMGLVQKLDGDSEEFGTMKGDHVRINLRECRASLCYY